MKKSLHFALTVCLAVFVCTIQAQHLPTYQDGKIWFKLKEQIMLPATAPRLDKRATKTRDVSFDELPFLQPLIGNFGLQQVYRPFFASDSPILQNTFTLEFSAYQQSETLLKELLKTGMVEYAERIPMDYTCHIPNDPNFSQNFQWGLIKINAIDAWDISTGNNQVRVGIVDNAFDLNHSEISLMVYNNMAENPTNQIDDDWNGYLDDRRGYDVADWDNNLIGPSNAWSHGTHNFGIICSRTNNNNGIASIGYNIRVIPVKATKNSSSPNSITHGYEGITYAVLAGARVINCPWGSELSSVTAQNVINWAQSKNVLIVAAAGNANATSNFYPAAYNNVMGVGATAASDKKSPFSNYGPNIDVMAPGSDIYSTVPTNAYAFMSGTSQASALVTGLAGLMLSLNPNMPVNELVNCMKGSCDNIDYMNTGIIGQMGSGRINAYKAMQCLQTLANTSPVVNFYASDTVIFAGTSITFFDQSTNIPSTYQWTFAGGTPSSSTQQNPTITYNTPGNYTVTLQATNNGGNGVKTKNFYITVLPTTGCTQISNTQPGDQILTYTIGAGGFLGGHNQLNPKITRWADYYVNPLTHSHITGAEVHITRLYMNDPNNIVTFTLWDASGPGNAPNNVIATKNVTLKEIDAYVGSGNAYKPMTILFDSAIALPPGNFHVGVQITHAPGDSIAIAYTQNLINIPGRPNTAWSYGFFSAQWYQLSAIFGGTPEFNMHIYPLLTNNPVKAVASPQTSTICVGDTVQFSSAGSTNATSFAWKFHGAFPASSTDANPKAVFTLPGSHYQYLQAINSCGTPAGATIMVNVVGVSDLNVTSALADICAGGATNIEANSLNGATYTWSHGLPATAGPHTVAPTQTTTYTVTADSGGCSQTAHITITVKDVPVASAMYFPNTHTICRDEKVWFDPTNTSDANTYSWSFTNGTPASSTAKHPTVTYATSGTHPFTLTAVNACGSNQFNGTILIGNCTVTGLDENTQPKSIIAFFPDAYVLQANLQHFTPGQTEIYLYNALGQTMYAGTHNLQSEQEQIRIPVQRTHGMYLLQIHNNGEVHTLKIMH